MFDVAPSDWMNPAWMHTYDVAEPYSMAEQGLGEMDLATHETYPSSSSRYFGDTEDLCQPQFVPLAPQSNMSFHLTGEASDRGNG